MHCAVAYYGGWCREADDTKGLSADAQKGITGRFPKKSIG
jgi:hypothetical protein